MGEAKRRQKIFGEKYGTPETSRRKLHKEKIENPLPKDEGLPEFDSLFKADSLPKIGKLMPDYGTYYLQTFGKRPLYVEIGYPNIGITNREGNITWNAYGYMATLIVTPEFARQYQKNSSQMLCIVPDPEDAYTTPFGERVIPFKLAATE
jgi:hypothetical protein